jgi:hypothetical protein
MDGSNPERKRRHHRPMHSSRNGLGHDARRRLAKRKRNQEHYSYCGRKVKKAKEKK